MMIKKGIIPDFSIEKSALRDNEGALGQIRRESGLISEVSQILPLHKKVHEKNPGYPAKRLKTPSEFFAAALRANFACLQSKRAKFGIIPIALIFAALFYFNLAEGGGNMEIESPAFENNQFIPDRFTGKGENVNPLLVIKNIPKGAKSLALIVDDPDAPAGTWVHWVVFDIPITSRIEENSIPGKQGNNNSGGMNYHGPYPPPGATHRYFFKIYALDTVLNLKEGINKAQLEKAMQGHILDKAELIGLYKR